MVVTASLSEQPPATNISAAARAGAVIIVAGASVFHTPDPAAAVASLRKAATAP